MTTSLAPGDDERLVTLVLCDSTGNLLGELPPVRCTPQYWPELADVVATARSHAGVDVTVLRLLTAGPGQAGGAVSYLAQLAPDAPTPELAPVSVQYAAAAASDPAHRLWWAQPAGLDWVEDWVDAVLAPHGASRTGPLHQQKSWNLSCVLTAATTAGLVWFKAVPPFLADEGGIVARVALVDPHLTPAILGHHPDLRAVLMADVDGEDQWGLAHDRVIGAMLDRWVAAQAALVDDVAHCLSAGAADSRSSSIVAGVRRTLDVPETRATLSAAELDALERMADDLPGLLAEIQACGLPDTLVHGDLHPGNWRRLGNQLTLLDWGDCRVGNPVLDMRAFLERIEDAGQRLRTGARWVQAWQRRVPGCDPQRAADLAAPVAELCAAVTYQGFLDHIEVTERPYHRADPVDRLRAALAVRTPSAS